MFVACDKDGTLHIHQTKPKQVVVLETWLCAFENDYYMSEATAGYFEGIETVKLLSTREVEL